MSSAVTNFAFGQDSEKIWKELVTEVTAEVKRAQEMPYDPLYEDDAYPPKMCLRMNLKENNNHPFLSYLKENNIGDLIVPFAEVEHQFSINEIIEKGKFSIKAKTFGLCKAIDVLKKYGIWAQYV